MPKVGKSDGILPRSAAFPLIQRNLSELYSAPGRQAASMLRQTHLRSLEYQLSAIATATSLAEFNPSMAVSSKGVYLVCFSLPIHGDMLSHSPLLTSIPHLLEPNTMNDPLRMTPEDLKSAYNFVLVKPTVTKPVVQRKKSASSKDSTPSPAKVTKRKSAAASKTDQSSKTSAASRKRKSATQAETAARAAQRRKSDLAKQQRHQQHLKQQQPPPQQQHQKQHQLQQPQYPQMNEQAFQPRPIMTQPQQQHSQQSGPSRQQPMAQQQQQPAQYNQFMGALPSPIGTQQQRGSFTQFPNTPQMNQFRMMQQQQQQQQQPNQQQMNYGQHPQGLQQMPQFFPQMGQQQYPQQPMQMPGQGVVGPPGTMQMTMQHSNSSSHGNSGNNSIMRQNMPSADDQSDPLFMLKDM